MDLLKNHEDIMLKALEQAKLAFEHREVPVGCVIVEKKTGNIVSSGFNQTNITNNATRHCEIVAVETLSKNSSASIKWSDYALYVSVEPCIMCAAALRLVGLLDVVYGCDNERFGGCQSVLTADRVSAEYIPALNLISGVLKFEAIRLLQEFYERGNVKLPEAKRHRRKKNDSVGSCNS
jgi:tRNA(Arg) A34 adenosine deaminase TadA